VGWLGWQVWRWRIQPWPRFRRSEPRLCSSVSWVLGPKPSLTRLLSHFAWVLANLSRYQQPALWRYLPGFWGDKPTVLTHIARSISNVSELPLPYVSELLSHISTLLANLSIVLSDVADVQPNFACAPWSYVAVL
jgi:hypothetical protein